MRHKLTSYSELIRKAESLNDRLYQLSIWSKSKEGRFQSYIKTVRGLNESLKDGKSSEFLAKYNKDGHIMFILKQLYEFTYILSPILGIIENQKSERVKEIKEKLKISLSGPIYPRDENSNNNSPRNNQFELLVFSRLFLSGYKDLQMLKNPDILTQINGRIYPIECKRVIGQAPRTIIVTVDNAVDQISKNWDSKFFGGVVAVDLTVKYEQGSNILDGATRESAENFVQNQLEQDFNFIHNRCPKLIELATKNKIVGLMFNVSCVYVIKDIKEMGWMNELALLVFNKENPLKAPVFIKDFSQLKQSHIGL